MVLIVIFPYEIKFCPLNILKNCVGIIEDSNEFAFGRMAIVMLILVIQ